jgi:hypothetical protein
MHGVYFCQRSRIVSCSISIEYKYHDSLQIYLLNFKNYTFWHKHNHGNWILGILLQVVKPGMAKTGKELGLG